MEIPKLWMGKNLKAEILELGEPWKFTATPDALEIMRDKVQRKKEIQDPATEWNIYTGFAGAEPKLRITKENPSRWMLALIIDFDRSYTIEEVKAALDRHFTSNRDGGQRLIPKPNYIERTLSGNIRLVWLFERPVPLPTPAFAADLFELFRERIQFDVIMRGYDKASAKPAQTWTNSGEWADLKQLPVNWKWLLGLMMEVSKRERHAGVRTIPLELIAAEFEKRWPGKWKGEFKLDETGTRIWDEKADNPAGCQIKLDGMLCFTGPYPFRSWSDILGADWVKANTELNQGKLVDEFRYNPNDMDYYQLENGLWTRRTKDDVVIRLRNRGVDGKVRKGETNSQMDEIIEAIQVTGKVSGVGPIVSKPPGIVQYNGLPWINTANIKVVQAVEGPTHSWEDCAFIVRVMKGFDTDKKGLALASLQAWHLRSWQSQRDYAREMGQAVFICGPRNTGKTLYAVHIFAGSMGGGYSNPFRYFTGASQFNVQLFSQPILMVNDEESPSTDAERNKLHARIKSSVVNPTQEVEAKYRTPTIVDWTGRVIWTLNDDAGDTQQLPEVVNSNEDKMMFFRMIDTGIQWPSRAEVEALIAKQLPHYLWCLENLLQTPKEIIIPGRMGLKSYYDPQMRRWSMQNTASYAVWELLEQWIKVDAYWFADNGQPTDNETWIGTAAELMMMLKNHDQLTPLFQGITARSFPKLLTALSKQKGSGVESDHEARGRRFIIHRSLSDL